jgi:hypothetical protein
MIDNKKVFFRAKIAMAVILRNVINHDWGFFSKEDQRMHLQTVDLSSLKGPNKAKVWLEECGRRTCESADGKIVGSDLKKLQIKIASERAIIEIKWIHFMISNDWIKAELHGSTIILTAYPDSHNRYKRTIDLKALFPGAYKGVWDINPPKIDFDRTNGLLAVGFERDLDERNHILISDYLFKGP